MKGRWSDNCTNNLRLANSNWTTVEQIKTWFNSNNMTLYFVKETSSDEEITDDTLIQDLNDLYNIMSINGTTCVEIIGDLQGIIKLRALKGE